MEEIDMFTNPQKRRPISISSKLLKEENSELILLLKDFSDIFTYEYNKMLGLDLELVVHTLNVKPRAKLVSQPTKVFHADMDEQIIKKVQKLLATRFTS